MLFKKFSRVVLRYSPDNSDLSENATACTTKSIWPHSSLISSNNFIAASANITEMDEEAKKYPIITKVEKEVNLNAVMSNSFGFGGTNATLVFEKV